MSKKSAFRPTIEESLEFIEQHISQMPQYIQTSTKNHCLAIIASSLVSIMVSLDDLASDISDIREAYIAHLPPTTYADHSINSSIKVPRPSKPDVN